MVARGTKNPQAYDVIVLGAGAGGLTVAVGAAKVGKRVALIERGPIGGDCTNVGCVPSKTLIHLAAHGADCSPATILERVRERRDRLRADEEAWIDGLDAVDVIRGSAHFASAREVEVTTASGRTDRLRAGTIVIATGSRPSRLHVDGLPASRTLTNESLFELTDVPRHLVVVGAGAVGTEMAFAFRSLGCHVTVVQRSGRVLTGFDPHAGDAIAGRMRDAGIDVRLGAVPQRFDETDRTLTIAREDGLHGLHDVDAVLLAVGRRPNVDAGLEAAGVRYDASGIPTDTVGRTNVRGVRAVGDVVAGSAATHDANAAGRRVVRSIALPWLPAGAAPVRPRSVFADPEVAAVGPSEEDLAARYAPELLVTMHVDLRDTDRGYTMGLDVGFVRLTALRLSGRLVAATIVAPGAGEMISLLTWALQRRVRLWSLTGLVFPYPVLSDAIKKGADAFAFGTLPRIASDAKTYARHRWRRPRTSRDLGR
ncbi:MAG: NAD(P)/FAD-dependent oxidoreductase [Trueperaceae bacterium]